MRRETASKCYYVGERAIVVGGGLAGLSAARALSDRFRQVVILDRDELPDSATPRPGVPQGKHPHSLLGGGLKALVQCIIDLQSISLLNLLGVSKTVEIGAA